MKNLKNIFLALIATCTQLHGAERPPQPPAGKKLPTFGQMIQQEEKRRKDETIKCGLERSSQAALIHVRNANPASLQGLPTDIQAIVLPYLARNRPLNIKAIANTILALSGTSKALHAAMNEPRTLLAIFNALPYTANAVDLAERLQRKPNTMPGMQKPEMQAWLKNAKASLVRAEELFRAAHSRNNHIWIQQLVKIKNLDLNWQNPEESNRTALILAAEVGDTETIRALLQAGANPDLIKKNGVTALMYSAYRNLEGVELLLQSGADPNIRAENRATALQEAVWRGNPDIVALLLKYGADPEWKDERGKTARDYANDELGIFFPEPSDKLKEYVKILKLLDETIAKQKSKQEKK